LTTKTLSESADIWSSSVEIGLGVWAEYLGASDEDLLRKFLKRGNRTYGSDERSHPAEVTRFYSLTRFRPKGCAEEPSGSFRC